MTTAVDKCPAAARLVAVAATGHLPTAPTPPPGTRPAEDHGYRGLDCTAFGGVDGRLSVRMLDTFGPYGSALAPGVTAQESDRPAITDDRLAQRPFQRLIRLVRRSTTVPF